MSPEEPQKAWETENEGPFYYILEGRTPVPCSRETWERFFILSHKMRRVAETKLDGYYISTVFLGLDLDYRNEPPLLFETMIFGGQYSSLDSLEHDDGKEEYQERCSTWEEAEAQHAKAIRHVENLIEANS